MCFSGTLNENVPFGSGFWIIYCCRAPKLVLFWRWAVAPVSLNHNWLRPTDFWKSSPGYFKSMVVACLGWKTLSISWPLNWFLYCWKDALARYWWVKLRPRLRVQRHQPLLPTSHRKPINFHSGVWTSPAFQY